MLQIKADKLKNSIVLVAMFLSAMNFGAKFFYFVFATLILLSLFQRKVYIHYTTILYFLWGIIMAIYNIDEGMLSMLRCFAYVSYFIVGYNFVTFKVMRENNSFNASIDNTQKIATKIFATVALGSFTHYLLNFISNFGNKIGRNTIDIWSGEVMAATGQAAFACLMMGLSVAFILLPQKSIYRYIGVISIVLILAYDLILAGRTLIIMLFILFIIGMIYFQIVTPKANDRFKLVLVLLFIFMIGVVLYLLDIGDIRKAILNSTLLERFNSLSLESTRNDSKIQYLINLWRYPFGGCHLRLQYGHAHDLLLDGYDEYGIVGFLLLLLILILGIRSLWKLLYYTDYSHYFKIIALCVYSAFLLIFTVEPILDGMPWLMVCFSLINGTVEGMCVINKRWRRNE